MRPRQPQGERRASTGRVCGCSSHAQSHGTWCLTKRQHLLVPSHAHPWTWGRQRSASGGMRRRTRRCGARASLARSPYRSQHSNRLPRAVGLVLSSHDPPPSSCETRRGRQRSRGDSREKGLRALQERSPLQQVRVRASRGRCSWPPRADPRTQGHTRTRRHSRNPAARRPARSCTKHARQPAVGHLGKRPRARSG